MLTCRTVTRTCLGIATLSILGLPGASQAQPAEAVTPSAVEDYQEAANLVGRGKLDEAAYWFYRGQLRGRIYLRAHPNEPPDGTSALFASFDDVLGRPINEHAFGDISTVVATIDRVLAWHAANDDPATPKAQYGAAHEQVRSGLIGFRNQILAERDDIRRTRQKNGLPNRT